MAKTTLRSSASKREKEEDLFTVAAGNKVRHPNCRCETARDLLSSPTSRISNQRNMRGDRLLPAVMSLLLLLSAASAAAAAAAADNSTAAEATTEPPFGEYYRTFPGQNTVLFTSYHGEQKKGYLTTAVHLFSNGKMCRVSISSLTSSFLSNLSNSAAKKWTGDKGL